MVEIFSTKLHNQKRTLLILFALALLIIPISLWAMTQETRTRFQAQVPATPPISFITPHSPDVDHDGDVDFIDRSLLKQSFGQYVCGNSVDLDYNCRVNIFDYAYLLAYYGQIMDISPAIWSEISQPGVTTIGNPDASVTMVEFIDYQCPFCQSYNQNTFNQIKLDYIDTQKINYVIHDYPLGYHANALDAALAARCALDQNAYFEYRDQLFINQGFWSTTAAPATLFVSYASQINLDTSLFSACLTNKTHEPEIMHDIWLGDQVGVRGTPVFFINQQKITGAAPYSKFESILNAKLYPPN